MLTAHAFSLTRENLFGHVASLQQSLPGMRRLDLAGRGCVQLVDSGLPTDTFNKILWNCGTDLRERPVSQDDALACLADASARIAECGRDFSLWRGEDAPLPDFAGLTLCETETAMFLPLNALPASRLDEALCRAPRIVRVSGLAELAAFSSVLAANWSPPDQAVMDFYRLAAEPLLQENSPMRLFVGFAGDTPACCGEIFFSHNGETAGLHMIGTRADYRRQGFGTAMSAALLGAGIRAGAGLATLLASPAGEPVYRELGFAACGVFHEYSLTEEIVHA